MQRERRMRSRHSLLIGVLLVAACDAAPGDDLAQARSPLTLDLPMPPPGSEPCDEFGPASLSRS